MIFETTKLFLEWNILLSKLNSCLPYAYCLEWLEF